MPCARRNAARRAAKPASLAAGWQLPLDPPGPASTLGGTLAAAAIGPRAQGFGRPRDCVLGLEVALADGRRTHCGGRVVKNVTGYDLTKLYTGSLRHARRDRGGLAPAAPAARARRAARVRARSRPARRAPARSPPRAAARRASPRCTPRSRAAEAQRVRVVVELAGDAASVERDVDWCTIRARREAPQRRACSSALRDLQGSTPRGRRTALPHRAAAVAQRSRARAALAGGRRRALPSRARPRVRGLCAARGRGCGCARRRSGARVDAVAATAGAAVVLEAAPAWAKRGRDVFGDLAGALPLARRAEGSASTRPACSIPGRFVGGLTLDAPGAAVDAGRWPTISREIARLRPLRSVPRRAARPIARPAARSRRRAGAST